MEKTTRHTKLTILFYIMLLIVTIALTGSSFKHSKAQISEMDNNIANKNSIHETIKYSEYLKNYKYNDFSGNKISIIANSYIAGTGIAKVSEYDGKENVIYTDEQSYVTYEVDVKESGLYTINVDYYPLEGYGGNIERKLLIDNKLPYKEAERIEFTRIYGDEVVNPSGNKTRPNQIELPRWNNIYLTDALGYFGDGLYFYLEKGKHTITLEAIKEPMAISSITLESVDISPKSYDEVLSEHRSRGMINVSGALENGVLYIQAENTYEKGDPTLYALGDTTSTKNQPYSYKERYMNSIGGIGWKYSNQWMSWKFLVPESGFYYIGVRGKQNYVRDIYCNRTLYIDGKIPFAEASNLHFDYDDEWKVREFGNEEPFLFYLEEGEHTISLKVTAGDLKDILTEADYILENLNNINMELLALLSINPDVDRDYQIARYMPDTVQALKESRDRLQIIYNELYEKTGKKDVLTSQLEQLIDLLENMHKNPGKIASLYSRYRDLVGTFGNWIMTVREHPVQLDYLYIAEPSAKVNKKEDGFFTKVYSGIVSIVNSFFTDSSMISEVGDGESETITVWIGSGLTGGRDQAMALNQMIQQSFSSESNIAVNLQLVPEDTILMATLAGRGPDVALQVKMTVPVDFALRNAVYDLTQFEDFWEVNNRFFHSAAEPFEYNGGVYALPESMSFPMLFYRTDILSELGIDVSQLKTWDSIVEILPILQGKNMNFALPATMQTYSMFLYQMGGEYYSADGMASALGTKTSLDAFEYWTELYKIYSLPVDFSFENRFRTGEMPIGIADYTTYNLLSISAPEIRGKWAMIELPGIVDSNNIINNTSPITSQGCILMNTSNKKDAAWEFMKWWTDAETQYNFGRQLEAVMGAAARYNTANKEALQRLPWAAVDRIGLMNQAEHIRGIPQIAGGYFTERNLNFAKLEVINDSANPRESLTDYSESITEEIIMKRKEFGLD